MHSLIPTALRRLLRTFDQAEDHVVLTDQTGRILYANKAAEAHTGFRQRSMAGKKPGALWGGRMSKEFYRDMWKTIAEEHEPFIGAVHNRRRDGGTYWQELFIVPVLDHRGQSRFYLGLEPEIDDPSRHGRFLACRMNKGTWHVKWPVEWLLESGMLSSNPSPHTVNALVTDLLIASDPRALEQHVRQYFSLRSLVKDVVTAIRREYPQRQYVVRIKPGRTVIHKNKQLLRALLLRLLRNAAQFTAPHTGIVTVRMARTTQTCQIIVEDNGPGISENERPRIFRKFFRGRLARQRYPEGLGLGLFVARTIAQARGWDLSCMSGPGKGTCMKLLFTLRELKGR